MNTEILEKACKLAEKQLAKIVESAERDGKLPIQDAECVNYLTHTNKSVKTTLAMEGYGSSERRSSVTGRYVSRDGGSYDGGSYGGGSYGGGSYDGGSYRGGSYDGGSSRRGSYDRSMRGDEREQIERMIRDTDDERVKRALTEAMHKM